MMAVKDLPQGYKTIYTIDLQKNKNMAWIVNLLSIAIGVLLVVPVSFIIPLSSLIDFQGGIKTIIKYVAIIVLMTVYLVLHELVHGIAMKICGTKKIKYGFTGLYAFAGSDDYYDKKSYIFIALAPIVFWGIVIAIITFFVPYDWFWVIYFIQVFNISGAAGDLFVSVKFSRLPKDILIKDYGVGMMVYSESTETEE